MKGTLKRVMSGVLSVITIASAVAQPMTAYTAEPEKAASSFEAQYPELEAVKDKLAEDEILTANDYSIDYGSDFDIKVDFSGIEGINDVQIYLIKCVQMVLVNVLWSRQKKIWGLYPINWEINGIGS